MSRHQSISAVIIGAIFGWIALVVDLAIRDAILLARSLCDLVWTLYVDIPMKISQLQETGNVLKAVSDILVNFTSGLPLLPAFIQSFSPLSYLLLVIAGWILFKYILPPVVEIILCVLSELLSIRF
jgi:ABC-type amino acid transport system permease subunit